MTRIIQKLTTFAVRFLPRLVVGGVLLLAVATAQAGPTAEQSCQAAKNTASGKYAACRQNAEAKLSTNGKSAAYTQALLRCEYKFASTWERSEAKATANGTTCRDAALDQGLVQAAIDECTTNVATALAGGGLTDCGNGVIDPGEDCDFGTLNSETCITRGFSLGGILACRAGCEFDTAGCYVCTPHSSGTFTDNCDGTVSDSATGLMWEKKTTVVGSGVNYADAHDVDNIYTWTASGTPYPADGTAFTNFLVTLNTPPCFAGYCDWRLPTSAGRSDWGLPSGEPAELENLFTSVPCLTPPPCIDPIFGPTTSDPIGYWSATTLPTDPFLVWGTNFEDSYVGYSHKDFNLYVRAVRDGS